jgi:hypothetical protein
LCKYPGQRLWRFEMSSLVVVVYVVRRAELSVRYALLVG